MIKVHRQGALFYFDRDLNDMSLTKAGLYGRMMFRQVSFSCMEYLIFTYGTLMKGRTRSHVLDGSVFVGDGILEDYALLELGSYPGAVYKTGSTVYGELYLVDEETKRELDWIEGEGYLYKFKTVSVLCNGEYVKAGFYEYLRDDGSCPLYTRKGKWHD